MDKTILHIDFDSFFASVEQQEHPEFRGRPLGVTAHNGRTAIIAASREAKKRGVKSPSRTYDAKLLCPDLVLTRANFTLYWEVSKKFISICKDYSPYVEIFSLDELFMDVTKTAHLFGGVDAVITMIKDRIRDEIGEYITVSIGISYNKLLAKLASGLRKPNGVVFIRPEDVDTIYKEAELTDICGIGFRIETRLRNMGITTLLRLRQASLGALVAEFGNVEGHFLKNVGLGIDESPVVPYTEAPEVKSAGRNYCLARNEFDTRVIFQNIFELCEEVGIKLRRLDMKARTVGISLRGRYTLFQRHTYQYYFDSGADIFRNCVRLVEPSFFEDNYVRQISIWTSNLTHNNVIPYDLFNEQKKRERLTKVCDSINEKYGDHTIRNGYLLYGAKLTTVPNGFGSDRYERTKFAGDSLDDLAEIKDYDRESLERITI